MSSSSIHVGLVGFGVAGRVFHAPIIRATPGLRLSCILERTGDHAARSYPDVHVARTLDEILGHTGIRLVVVATPNTTHADIARRCLKAGHDVVIDKPFATTSAEAAGLAELARRNGRLLSVYHNRRWDGDFLTAQRLVREGVCGRPVLFESHFDRYRPHRKPGAWRERAEPGSGLLFDLGSHLVDQALALFGRPDAVTADLRLERDESVTDDAFDVTLHYPRMRALLRGTMLACEPGPRFILRGTDGTYVKYHTDPQEDRLKHGDRPRGDDWGEEPREHWGTLTRASGDHVVREQVPTARGDYRGYYENVRDAIYGHTAPAVTPEQALDVMRLLELAQESSRQGRTMPVSG